MGKTRLRAAFKSCWPEAPHQLCQMHFLGNLAEEVLEEDDSNCVKTCATTWAVLPSVPQNSRWERPDLPFLATARDVELQQLEQLKPPGYSRCGQSHTAASPFTGAGWWGNSALEAIQQALLFCQSPWMKAVISSVLQIQIKRALEKTATRMLKTWPKRDQWLRDRSQLACTTLQIPPQTQLLSAAHRSPKIWKR